LYFKKKTFFLFLRRKKINDKKQRLLIFYLYKNSDSNFKVLVRPLNTFFYRCEFFSDFSWKLTLFLLV
jgi:hypothetical protein